VLVAAVLASSTSAVWSAGCSKDDTSRGGLMLIVTQDGSLALDRISIEVVSKGRSLKSTDYRVPADTELPTSLAIASNGDPNASVQIAVVAWRGDVALDRRDQVVEHVPPHRVAALTVSLTAKCSPQIFVESGVAKSRCAPDETCSGATGNCAPARVDAAELPTASPDLGAVGAGPDTGAPGDAQSEATLDDGGVIDPYRTAVLADGPHAYFRFEESSGSVCKNEIVGSPVTCILPTTNVTLGAPGSGGSRRGVRLEDATATISMSGGMTYAGEDPFTVEAWLWLESLVPTANVFINQEWASLRTGQLLFLNDEVRFHSETWAQGTLLFYTESPTPAVAKTWHHVVYGYSPALGRDFAYVDAVESGGQRTAGMDGGRIAPVSPLYWGGTQMTIDDIVIYSKALLPSQIALHFAAR
jgi:hypothetical protein